jgi:hypothetical protein
MSSTTDIIKKMVLLRDEVKQSLDKLMTNNPRLNRYYDVRITFFSKSFKVMDSVILYLINAHKYLTSNRWWTETTKQYQLNPRLTPSLIFLFYIKSVSIAADLELILILLSHFQE